MRPLAFWEGGQKFLVDGKLIHKNRLRGSSGTNARYWDGSKFYDTWALRSEHRVLEALPKHILVDSAFTAKVDNSNTFSADWVAIDGASTAVGVSIIDGHQGTKVLDDGSGESAALHNTSGTFPSFAEVHKIVVEQGTSASVTIRIRDQGAASVQYQLGVNMATGVISDESGAGGSQSSSTRKVSTSGLNSGIVWEITAKFTPVTSSNTRRLFFYPSKKGTNEGAVHVFFHNWQLFHGATAPVMPVVTSGSDVSVNKDAAILYARAWPVQPVTLYRRWWDYTALAYADGVTYGVSTGPVASDLIGTLPRAYSHVYYLRGSRSLIDARTRAGVS